MEHRSRAIRAACLIALAFGAIALGACDGETEGNDSSAAADAGNVEARMSGVPSGGNLLFVLRGAATVTDDRVEIDAETVEWFTDRPQRRAGVAHVEDLIDNWSEYGFAGDPPNAALTGAGTDAVVVLTDPRITDGGVAFAFSTISGELKPGDAGSLSVFIDSSANRCYVDINNNTPYGWGLDSNSDLKPDAGSWSEGDPGGGPDTTIDPHGTMGSAFNGGGAQIFYGNTTYPDDDPYGPKGDGSFLFVSTSCLGGGTEDTRATDLHCDFIGPANDKLSCSKRKSGRHAVFTLEEK